MALVASAPNNFMLLQYKKRCFYYLKASFFISNICVPAQQNLCCYYRIAALAGRLNGII